MKWLKIILATALIFLICDTYAYNGVNPEGKLIFMTRCASCHNVNKDVTGPALANVYERRSIEWIVTFVHSPNNLIKKGDKDAVALFNRFNQVLMPDHGDLTREQISSILDFIKTETKSVSADKPPFDAPGKLQPSYIPLSIHNTDYIIGYLAAVVLLVVVLLFAVRVKELERKSKSEKEVAG